MQMLIARRPKKKAQFTLAADLHEIHTYIDDMGRITLLRDKCVDVDEKDRYNTILKVMQLVLHRLNELGGFDGRLRNMENFGIGSSVGQRQSTAGQGAVQSSSSELG